MQSDTPQANDADDQIPQVRGLSPSEVAQNLSAGPAGAAEVDHVGSTEGGVSEGGVSEGGVSEGGVTEDGVTEGSEQTSTQSQHQVSEEEGATVASTHELEPGGVDGQANGSANSQEDDQTAAGSGDSSQGDSLQGDTEEGEPSRGLESSVATDQRLGTDSDGDDGGTRGRPLPRTIAVANQKGGVGKTTTTVNIAACLAEQGFRTLLVDLDPQANASTGLGLEPRELAQSVYHVMLHGEEADSCIEPTEVKNLFVLPSSLDLAGAEIELVPAMSREHRLRVAIESVIDDYDYVLIDCPPSLGLLTINALAAASEVLVPIQCEYYALEGLGQLMRNVDLVRANLNPTLEISHIVLVMFDPRTKLAGQVVDEVREHFGDTVCQNVIPRTVRLSEAPSFGQPITTFDSESRGATAYRAVTQEVIDGQA